MRNRCGMVSMLPNSLNCRRITKVCSRVKSRCVTALKGAEQLYDYLNRCKTVAQGCERVGDCCGRMRKRVKQL